ncbi:Uncharacterised protein [Enterobacter asburiae]|uniref:Uncharacterized protein n=1 Tax=Enterobacter asburiae TaxID=61645 RepID=A0A376FIH6_ENTAS|nr:Uncharacterised protein [Enterobacter asburiae]
MEDLETTIMELLVNAGAARQCGPDGVTDGA